MIKGLHYEETYAPVVQWATIRFFISLAILSNWHTRQLVFVLAYTQADIERDLYMMRAAPLGSASSEASPVRSSYALRRQT